MKRYLNFRKLEREVELVIARVDPFFWIRQELDEYERAHEQNVETVRLYGKSMYWNFVVDSSLRMLDRAEEKMREAVQDEYYVGSPCRRLLPKWYVAV